MIHCRDHLINWLVKESKSDVLLHNALTDAGTRVELFGLFDPLPGGKHPGWLVDVTSHRGRKDLIAIVKDYLDRPARWYIAGGIDWDNWQGPSDDVLVGGDANGPVATGQRRFHRIERCTAVHSQEDRGTSKSKTVPPVVKKRSNPPNVPPPL